MSNPWNYVAGGLLAIAFSFLNILLGIDISRFHMAVGIALILFIFACVFRLEEYIIDFEKHKSLDSSEQPEA